MKGKFTIKSVVHGNARFLVIGYINGKRKREYFHTRAEAQVHCEKRNIEIENYGHSGVEMSNTLRREALFCQDRVAELGLSLTTVVDHYCTLYKRIAPMWVSLDTVVDHYRAEHDWISKSVMLSVAWKTCESDLKRRLTGNEISIRHYETMIRAGRKLVKDFPHKQLYDLTSLVLKNWLSALPVAATTKNNLKTNLSGFFTFAKGQGWIKENPCAEVEKFNEHRIKAKPPGIVTPEQAAALLENAEPDILPFFAIGLFAGLRVAELQRLEWSEVDFDEKLINVAAHKSKTAQARWVPMTENLVAWLEPYRKARGLVVPKFGKRELIESTRAAAGIADWGHEKANALRHSFCSYHLAFHKDSARTAHDAGHMDSKMLFSNYNNRVKQEAAFKYFSIAPAPEVENIFAIA
jgi:integrase